MYPNADQEILVCDNLNTHNIASLYETFEPEVALSLQSTSKYIIRQNTAAGWTLQRLNSPHLAINVFLNEE